MNHLKTAFIILLALTGLLMLPAIFQYFWGWFVVPLGLPAIPYLHALGLVMLLQIPALDRVCFSAAAQRHNLPFIFRRFVVYYAAALTIMCLSGYMISGMM